MHGLRNLGAATYQHSEELDRLTTNELQYTLMCGGHHPFPCHVSRDDTPVYFCATPTHIMLWKNV